MELNCTWFIGVVEDRDDPLMIGRVRVRCFNVHSFNISEVPTNMLPWAIPLQNIISTALGGVGLAPVGIKLGATVMGVFVDGPDAQIPIIFGTMAGLPGGINEQKFSDVPAPTRGIANYPNNFEQKEPQTKFSGTAKYPYNLAMVTESGHIIEFDNTPGEERIHVRHKTGSYVQVDKTGHITIKSVADHNNVVKKDFHEFIGGSADIDIEGSLTIKAKGEIKIESDTHIEIKAPRIDEIA